MKPSRWQRGVRQFIVLVALVTASRDHLVYRPGRGDRRAQGASLGEKPRKEGQFEGTGACLPGPADRYLDWERRPHRRGNSAQQLVHYAVACKASALILEREGMDEDAIRLRAEAARVEELSLKFPLTRIRG